MILFLFDIEISKAIFTFFFFLDGRSDLQSHGTVSKYKLMLTPQLATPLCELKPLIQPDLKIGHESWWIFCFPFLDLSSFHPTSALKPLIWRAPHGIVGVLLLLWLLWMLLTGSCSAVCCRHPCSFSPVLSPVMALGSFPFAALHTKLQSSIPAHLRRSSSAFWLPPRSVTQPRSMMHY